MAKLPFHLLVEKIQTGRISEKDLAAYFIVEPGSEPFDFRVAINPRSVDVTRLERSALYGDLLLRDAEASIDAQANRKRKRRASPRYKRKSPIVAEGDSWFKLPIVPTLITYLQQQYAINNLATAGDTLANIVRAGEFWKPLKNGESDVLLFSAAGNDILNGSELWRFINLFDVDHSQPSDAPYYVNQALYDNLQIVMAMYEGVVEQIESQTPDVMMLGHGYDYVIPVEGGNWLGSSLGRQGHNPIDRPRLCEAIIWLMIDAFNSELIGLQRRHSKNFRHVDLRGTIGRREWLDELHPKSAGARKTAAKFAAALERLPASGTLLPPIPAARHALTRAA